ncbi:sulfotransferase 1C3-like [Gracilinanus agilis]|uniref:sulfotransferase 1C3-like n=1 Tax=Gracilinanus agilis TaxID=191870 RepID=UPI001CFD06B5|nr:sulfotransferase 1C3-like [Gracilinanus agilis]
MALTLATILGLERASISITSLTLYQANMAALHHAVNTDLRRVEQSLEALEKSLTSLSEEVLQNRQGLDLLFLKDGGLCAALLEECSFYTDHTGYGSEATVPKIQSPNYAVMWSEVTGMARNKVTEVIEGISLPGHLCTQESLSIATNFQFQDTDILLVTYPKSGTTWVQHILSLILSKDDIQNQSNIPTFYRAFWLEHRDSFEISARNEKSRPRIITTHLQAKFIIPNLKNSKVRVIYMARNPKDVLVSFYHFHTLAKFLPDFSSFDDFFDQFLEGKVHYGSWFDHIKGWLGVQHELNFFVITYEDLSQEPQQAIQSLAKFLGQHLEPEYVASILHYSTFSFMSQNDNLNFSMVPHEYYDHSNGKFFRKGVTGNWKEYFSQDQNIRFNNVYQAEMGDLTLKFPWSLD